MLESVFNRFAGLQVCNIIKKRLQRDCFPVNTEKFLRCFFYCFLTPPWMHLSIGYLVLSDILHSMSDIWLLRRSISRNVVPNQICRFNLWFDNNKWRTSKNKLPKVVCRIAGKSFYLVATTKLGVERRKKEGKEENHIKNLVLNKRCLLTLGFWHKLRNLLE